MPRQDASGRWVSDDGMQYWDGAAWRPLPRAAVSPPPGRPPRRPPWLWVAIASGVLLLLVVLLGAFIGGLAVGTPGRSAATPPPTVSATPIPTLTPTATPTPTIAPAPTPGTSTAEYVSIVVYHSQRLEADFTAVAGAGDLPTARRALATTLDEVRAFRTDLDAHPAPGSLAAADADLRSALDDYETGLSLAIQAVDENDAAKLEQATAYMDQAGQHLDNASQHIEEMPS